MRIPRQTRILLIADEQSAHRELVVSRRLVMGFLITGAVVLLLIIVLLLVYGRAVAHAQRAAQVETRLEAAEAEAANATALRQELEKMRGLQERLLAMLGVNQDDLAGDDITPGRRTPGAGLREQAKGVVTPRPSAWPVAGYVTREFTAKEGHPADHPGIDIAQPAETPILAPGDGTVARVSTDPFLGNFLELQHGLGYMTVYGHCSRVVVRAGVAVRRGQVIGYTGQTGEAAAPHLHFEIWHDGQPINPREVLRGDPGPA